jgi:hypothetical protein
VKSFAEMSPDEFAAYMAGYRTSKPAGEMAAATGFRFVRIGELEVSPPRWIVKGIIEREAFGLLFGDPAAGKSFVALDLAACIASGAEFHGREVKAPGPVCYIAGEGHAGIARRLRAWSIRRGIALESVPLFVSTTATALCDDDTFSLVESAILKSVEEAGPPALVVVDTWSRNLGGDENSAQDGAIAVRLLDLIRARWQCAALVVHHVGHADKTRGRGWSGLKAAVDTEYRVERGTDGIIRVENTKMKDGRSPAPMAFALRDVDLGIRGDDGEEVRSAVLDDVDYTDPQRAAGDPMGKNQGLALEALRRLYAEHRHNVQASGRDPDTARVTLKDWRASCAEDGIDRRRFPEAKDGLLRSGLVSLEGVHVLLVEAQRPSPCPNCPGYLKIPRTIRTRTRLVRGGQFGRIRTIRTGRTRPGRAMKRGKSLKSSEPIPPSGKWGASQRNRNRSVFLAKWQNSSIRNVSVYQALRGHKEDREMQLFKRFSKKERRAAFMRDHADILAELAQLRRESIRMNIRLQDLEAAERRREGR